jgi:penicillin-binding protein 2
MPRDPGVVEPYRLTPRLALRVAVLGGVVVLVFGALFLRLWALQVLSGTKYVSQAQAISSRTVAIQAPRGVILDRNRNVLVSNAATTAVELWPADLPKTYVDRYDELVSLARVTRVPLYQIAAAIKRHQGDPVTPVVIRESAGTSMVDYLSEHSAQFPGVETPPTYIRAYPYRALAA